MEATHGFTNGGDCTYFCRGELKDRGISLKYLELAKQKRREILHKTIHRLGDLKRTVGIILSDY